MSKAINPFIRIVGIFAVLMVFASAHAQTCALRDNGDGTMTDLGTGLQIQKCEFGQTWSSGRCIGDYKTINTKDTIRQFGQSEWRLITRKEAEQVAPRSMGCLSQVTLTSTLDGPENVWFFDIPKGQLISLYAGNNSTFRLVRSTQSSGNASASSSNTQRPNPAQNTQQTTAQSQSTQSQIQQSQQSAQQTQARADQQRQGQRKTHDPAAEAHECISIDKAGSGNFGAFKNQCPYPVNFTTCNEKPKTIQGSFNWSADFDCTKQQFGLHTPKGNSSVAAHNRNTEFVHWFACKAPAMPTDGTYVPGKGIEARCFN
jgi:hypothetical protein